MKKVLLLTENLSHNLILSVNVPEPPSRAAIRLLTIFPLILMDPKRAGGLTAVKVTNFLFFL